MQPLRRARRGPLAAAAAVVVVAALRALPANAATDGAAQAPRSHTLDLRRRMPVPETSTLSKHPGLVDDLARFRREAEEHPDCDGYRCPVSHEDLERVAARQFEAAQLVRRGGTLAEARELFGAACANFAETGNPSNVELIWNIGLGLQHDGYYREALDFYAGLRETGCEPFGPRPRALGQRFAQLAGQAQPRPECAAGDGDGGLRVRSVTVSDEAIGRAEWVAGLPEFCPVIDVANEPLGPQRFLDEYVMRSRPVVLRGLPGFADVFPSGQMFRNLVQDYGNRTVTAWATPHGRFWGKEEYEGAHAPARPAKVPMQLAELVQALQMNATGMGAFIYGEHINLEREIPELAERLVKAQLVSGPAPLAALPFRRVNLWLAPMESELQDTLHWDAHDSLLYQVECAKEFLLIPPGERENLPYDVGPEAGEEQGLMGPRGLEWRANVGGGRQPKVHWHLSPTLEPSRASAAVDLARPDLERFPRLEKALPPRKCTVRAGEALYIPAHWHRQVHFFGGRDAGSRCRCLNGAVDFWYRPLQSEQQAAEAAEKSLRDEL